MTYRVLYIDAEEDFQRLIERILVRLADCEVTQATRAEPGIEIAVNAPPDLILLNWRLFDMDAAEVVQILRQMPNLIDVPVVGLVTTTLSQNTIEQQARQAGCAGVIHFPLMDIREFAAGITYYIENCAGTRSVF